MEIKKWHLFAFIIILFVISFFVVNLKFDKFYRVNGINNDNRVLIENYLDEEEQEYLVGNQIPIEDFIEYIEIMDFKLQNYQYYNLLKDSSRYKQTTKIIEVGNNLATRLEFLYDDAFSKAMLLVEKDLEDAFMNNESFDFQYINVYSSLKNIYPNHDYSYIDDTITYINKLNTYGIKDIGNIDETMHMLCTAYTKESLSSLFSQPYNEKISIIYNPYEFSTIVNEYNYIGEYSPKDLLLTQDLPRVRYSMYLQKDAYQALVKMYQDLSESYDKFLLVEAFESYDSLSKDEDRKPGFEESQLGLTVSISQRELAYNQFGETEMSAWLQNHAYEYGYVLRNPKNKASVTNHSYDPHIYRYVGKTLAKTLYENNLTLEEYIAGGQTIEE